MKRMLSILLWSSSNYPMHHLSVQPVQLLETPSTEPRFVAYQARGCLSRSYIYANSRSLAIVVEEDCPRQISRCGSCGLLQSQTSRSTMDKSCKVFIDVVPGTLRASTFEKTQTDLFIFRFCYRISGTMANSTTTVPVAYFNRPPLSVIPGKTEFRYSQCINNR
jgi:hypothetical protein